MVVDRDWLDSLPSPTTHRAICGVCGWQSREWPTQDQAGCEASWHVYEQHREEWIEIIGSDRPPVDPDPRVGVWLPLNVTE